MPPINRRRVYEDGTSEGAPPIPGSPAWLEDNDGWSPDWNQWLVDNDPPFPGAATAPPGVGFLSRGIARATVPGAIPRNPQFSERTSIFVPRYPDFEQRKVLAAVARRAPGATSMIRDRAKLEAARRLLGEKAPGARDRRDLRQIRAYDQGREPRRMEREGTTRRPR